MIKPFYSMIDFRIAALRHTGIRITAEARGPGVFHFQLPLTIKLFKDTPLRHILL